MNERPTPREKVSEREKGATPARRFGFFSDTDPAAVIDTWKMYADRVTPEFEQTHSEQDFRNAEMICGILSEELQEFAKQYPRRAAEVVAEILGREDEALPLYSGAPLAILGMASSDRQLAAEMWEMFRELTDEATSNEAALTMREEIEAAHTDTPSAVSQAELSAARPLRRFETGDRVAMALFYLEYVNPRTAR